MRIGAGSDLDLAAMLQTCSNPRRPRRCWPSGATRLSPRPLTLNDVATHLNAIAVASVNSVLLASMKLLPGPYECLSASHVQKTLTWAEGHVRQLHRNRFV